MCGKNKNNEYLWCEHYKWSKTNIHNQSAKVKSKNFKYLLFQKPLNYSSRRSKATHLNRRIVKTFKNTKRRLKCTKKRMKQLH